MNRFLATLAVAAFVGTMAEAEIVKVTGDVKIIEAPSDVSTGRVESDSVVRVFVEKTDVELSQPIKLDISKPGTSPKLVHPTGKKGKPKKGLKANPNLSEQNLAPGKRINSYYIHFDSNGRNKKTASGSIIFGEKILGLIVESESLSATHDSLGASATKYPTGNVQGIEWNKGTEITLSPDRRTVSFKLEVSTAADNFRVITDASATGVAKTRRPKDVAPADPADQDDSPKEQGKQKKNRAAPPADGLLQVRSLWSGKRTSKTSSRAINCQIHIDGRDGDVYRIVYTEHHASIRITMYFKVVDRKMILVDWKNNSVADYSIEGFGAEGSTDGQGMQIGYHWTESIDRPGRRSRSRVNAPISGSIDVTRDR